MAVGFSTLLWVYIIDKLIKIGAITMVSKANYEFARLIQATAMPTAHYDDAKKNIGITDDAYDIDDNFANKMADIYGEYVNTLDTTRKLSDDEIKVVKDAANDLASNHQAKASLQDVVNHSLNNNSFMNLTNTQVASSEVYENYKNADGEYDGISNKDMFEAFYALERDFRFHTDEVDDDTYFDCIGPMIDSDVEMSDTANVDFPFATQCFKLDDEIKRQFEEVNMQSTPTGKDNIRSVYPEGFADKLDKIYGKQTMDDSLILFEDDNQFVDDEMKSLGTEKINQNTNRDNDAKQQTLSKSKEINEPRKTMAGKDIDLVVNSLRPIHYSTKNGEQKLGVLVDASKRGDVDTQKTTFDGSHVVNTYTKYGKPSHSQIVSVESARQILNVNGVKSLPNSAFASAANDKYDYGKELSKAGNTLTFTSNVFAPDDAKYGDFKFNPNPNVIKASDVEFNSEKHFEAVEAREGEHAVNKAKFEARKADKSTDESVEP